MKTLASLIDGLDRWVYPRRCLDCGQSPATEEEAATPWFLCNDCRERLKPIRRPYCERCGESFSSPDEALICHNCRDRKFRFEFAHSPYSAEGTLLHLIHQLKYGRQQYVAPLLAELALKGMAEPRFTGLGPENSVFVPVPLHAARLRERQFNQSEEIARALKNLAGIPVLNCLRRVQYTQPQARLGRSERLANLKGAFASRAPFPAGRTAILVDDVFTTGATTDQCARALVAAGATRIVVLTVARG